MFCACAHTHNQMAATNQPPPTIRTTRRRARVILDFVETISEVYVPAPSSVFPPSRPGLAKVVSNVVAFPAKRSA